MQDINFRIKFLLQNINNSTDKLLVTIQIQQEELTRLKIQNKELKENYSQSLKEIEEYIRQLEQIKHDYINNNINPK